MMLSSVHSIAYLPQVQLLPPEGPLAVLPGSPEILGQSWTGTLTPCQPCLLAQQAHNISHIAPCGIETRGSPPSCIRVYTHIVHLYMYRYGLVNARHRPTLSILTITLSHPTQVSLVLSFRPSEYESTLKMTCARRDVSVVAWRTSMVCGKTVSAPGAFPGSSPPTATLSNRPNGWSNGAEQLSGALEVRQPPAALQWLLAVAYRLPSIYLQHHARRGS